MDKQISEASQAILDLAKANNDVYLTAYRAGYEAGWKACGKECMKILESPLGEQKVKR